MCIRDSAGTASKPYTNFFGSYSPAYPGFVVTTSTNYSVNTTTNVTWTGSAYTTNLTYVTNFASYSYTSNSIVSIIYADVNGNFSLYGGSFTPVAPAPGFANFTVNGNLTLDNSLGSPNNLNFLLGTNTTLGGGVNDVIVVTNGTLNICLLYTSRKAFRRAKRRCLTCWRRVISTRILPRR